MIQIDIEMPKSCGDCRILQCGSFEHYCPLAYNTIGHEDYKTKRMNECPLKEMEKVEFTPEEMELIWQYQRLSESVSVKVAILNAVSLALDYND